MVMLRNGGVNRRYAATRSSAAAVLPGIADTAPGFGGRRHVQHALMRSMPIAKTHILAGDVREIVDPEAQVVGR